MASEKNIIRFVLALGLLHGLLFVFFIPPWEHYDEPGHFEYAWLIANRLRLPHPDDFDVHMRLAMGRSLVKSNFFTGRPFATPNLTDPSKPLWAGVTQLSDPPLYYILDALPLFILRGAPINTQMYGGRIFSLLFYLLCLWAAYQILVELTPPNSFLRWLVPLFLALLPGFVEFMSSINNHVAAIAVVSLWLLVAVKLIKRGLSLNLFGFLILLDLAGFYTQKVAWIVLLLTPIVLLLSGFRRYKIWIAWAAIAMAGIGSLFLFQWNDAALWLRRNYQDSPSRTKTSLKAPFDTALQAKLFPDNSWGQDDPTWTAGFFQLLPNNITKSLAGRVVTLGAWMWADKPAIVYSPGVNALYQYDDRWLGFQKIAVDTTPIFVSTTFQLPTNEDRIQIWIRATSTDRPDATLFVSGIVLAKGEWPNGTSPQFTDNNGGRGTWGGKPFVNLARNSLMRQSWPFPKPEILNLVTKRISGLDPTHVSSVIALLLDWKGSSWYTVMTSATIFRSFWAKFCWDQVPLMALGPFNFRPYFILGILSALGFLGCLAAGFTWRKQIPWNEVAFILITSILVCMVAYFYGVYIMGGGLRFRTYYPVARYIYPAMFPLASIIVGGWSALYALGRRWFKIRPLFALAVFLVFMVGLDIYSFLSIYSYFHSF